jgi:hypothetical protein
LSEHSNATLDALDELRGSLSEGATEAQIARWWSLVQQIESSIDSDPRASRSESEAVARIKATISDVFGSLNRNEKPNFHPAQIAVSGLRSDMGKRTIGLDGWPVG